MKKKNDLIIGNFYVSEFQYNGRSAKVVFIYVGSFQERTHLINADGKYLYSTCCNDHSTFRDATGLEIQELIMKSEGKLEPLINDYLIYN